MQELLHGSVLLQVAAGVGLAAATGLRAFLPAFLVGLLGRFHVMPLRSGFEWLESTPALVIFGTAVVLEILADKVPWVDHALDWVGTVIKPAAGAFVVVAALEQLPPLNASIIGLLLGGSVAGSVHVAKAGLRTFATGTSGGAASPLLSTAEDGLSLSGSLLAIFYPVFLFTLLVAGSALLVFTLWRWRKRRLGSRLPPPS